MHRIAPLAVLAALLIGSLCNAALATTVCGRNGCGQIFTKRVVHPPAGYVAHAAPLVFPGTNGRPLPEPSK